MTTWKGQFDPRMDWPSGVPVEHRYAICSTQRSGSHLLGHLLMETGRFGHPLEYYNPQNLAVWRQRARDAGTSEAEIPAFLESIRTSPNGCFGMKLHFVHLEVMHQFVPLDRLLSNYALVLMLRRDVVAQAVSYARARQTGSFISEVAEVDEPFYDRELIRECLSHILWQNACWQMVLASTESPFHPIYYEDLLRDPIATVRSIERFVGLDPGELSELRTIGPRPQSDERNAEWRARFIRETRGDGVFPSRFEVVRAGSRSLKGRLRAAARDLSNRTLDRIFSSRRR